MFRTILYTILCVGLAGPVLAQKGPATPATPTTKVPVTPATPTTKARPKLTPEQIKMLNSKQVRLQMPPYIFKKDGSLYTPPKISKAQQAKFDMLRKRGVLKQLQKRPKGIAPPVHGSFGDWMTFIHRVIHR